MTRNFLFTGLSIGSRLLTGLVVFIVLARSWGPELFGLFSFVFGVVSLLTLIVDFGYAAYVLREVGADPTDLPNIYHGGVRAKVRLTVFVLLVALTVSIVASNTFPPQIFLPMMLSGILLSFADYHVAPLRALGAYALESKIIVSYNLIQFVVIGSIAILGGGVKLVAAAYVVTRAAYLLIAWRSLTSLVPLLSTLSSTSRKASSSLRSSFPYALDSALTISWNQLDIVLVRVLYGAHTAGIYAAGQKLLQGACALAPVIGNVMIPRLAKLAATANPEFETVARMTTILMGVSGLLLSAPLLIFSDCLIETLFGSQYAELEEILMVFGVLILVKFASAGYGALLTSLGLQTRRTIYQACGLMVFIVASCIIFLSRANLEALLWSYVGGYALILALYFCTWMRRQTRSAYVR